MRVHRMNQHAVVLDNLLTGFRWAVPQGVPLIVGDTGDQDLTSRVIREHDVDAIIHFAASLIVPDSVRAPLTYYRNNTVNSQALIECAVNSGVRHFIFSSTAAVYGNPPEIPVSEDASKIQSLFGAWFGAAPPGTRFRAMNWPIDANGSPKS